MADLPVGGLGRIPEAASMPALEADPPRAAGEVGAGVPEAAPADAPPGPAQQQANGEAAAAPVPAAEAPASAGALPELGPQQPAVEAEAQPPGEVTAGGGADPPAEDREEFSRLRIVDRLVPAATVAEWVKGIYVPFTRIAELADRRRQERNHVIIGVLYDRSSAGKKANGERYVRWNLTDLAHPIPRRLVLHLRYRAFMKWHGGQAAADARRGSIFAVLNPFVMGSAEGRAPGELLAQVEKESQIEKLGECPSLGTCCIKGCVLPCNLDRGERVCVAHMDKAYAGKLGRNPTGGIPPSMAALLQSGRERLLRKVPRGLPAPVEAAMAPEEESREDHAVQARIRAALELDDRRFYHSGAHDSYIRGVLGKRAAEATATSRVPVLGRGLEDTDGLDLDFSTVDTAERSKADRMIGQRLEAQPGHKQAQARRPAKRQRSGDGQEAAEGEGGVGGAPAADQAARRGEGPAAGKGCAEPSLAELVQVKRMARRADVQGGAGGGRGPGPGSREAAIRGILAGAEQGADASKLTSGALPGAASPADAGGA